MLLDPKYYFTTLCLITVLASWLLETCYDSNRIPSHGVLARHQKPDSVASYIDSALKFIEVTWVNRDTVDWDHFRNEILKSCPDSPTLNDAHGLIILALDKLNDRHSNLYTADQHTLILPQGSRDQTLPEGHLLDNKYGYIFVPGISADTTLISSYSSHLHQIIQSIDAKHPIGWIVDLRHNLGGSMWPMLTGLGPLLGNGCMGEFVVPHSKTVPWYYFDGKGYVGTTIVQEIVPKPYVPVIPYPTVAVLISRSTVSAGEAVAVAFHGRQNTRFFGDTTFGAATGLTGTQMPDSAIIAVASAYFADRNGKIFPDGVPPDTRIVQQGPLASASDNALTEAKGWISGQEYLRKR
jgi:hypothetical protein